jgi:hypothetical protein
MDPWSEGRADHALELYDPDAASDYTGADCTGTGYSIRDHTRTRLYRKFNCDLYDDYGDYAGSGTIKVTGQSMRRYRWLSWDPA